MTAEKDALTGIWCHRLALRRHREPEKPKNKTPYENGVYDAACRDVASSGIEDASVEAAGIEPASRDVSMMASTCVVELFGVSPAMAPVDPVHRRLDENRF